MKNDIMELSLKEMELITGAMTMDEREAAVEASDDDSFSEAAGKFIMHPVVHGLDSIESALEPLNKAMDPISPERVRSTTKGAFTVLCQKISSWF